MDAFKKKMNKMKLKKLTQEEFQRFSWSISSETLKYYLKFDFYREFLLQVFSERTKDLLVLYRTQASDLDILVHEYKAEHVLLLHLGILDLTTKQFSAEYNSPTISNKNNIEFKKPEEFTIYKLHSHWVIYVHFKDKEKFNLFHYLLRHSVLKISYHHKKNDDYHHVFTFPNNLFSLKCIAAFDHLT